MHTAGVAFVLLSSFITSNSVTGMTIPRHPLLPKLPMIGLGSAESPDAHAMAGAVHAALQHGILLIDTAQNYGSEAAVGAGIKLAADDENVPCSPVILAKVDLASSATEDPAARMRRQVERTRGNLGLHQDEPLDLVALHWPLCLDKIVTTAEAQAVRRTAWQTLEAMVDEGSVGALGVSNFSPELLDELSTFAKFPPVINEVEFSPCCFQQTLLEACTVRNVALVGYSPYGTCWLSKYYADFVPWGKTNLLEHAVVIKVAEELKATPAQVCLAWSVHHGVIPIPKSTKAHRVAESAGAAALALSGDQVKRLDALSDPRRGTAASFEAHTRIIASVDYEWEAT